METQRSRKRSKAGREFSHDLIKRVTDLLEEELLYHLSVLKDSELLYERGIYPQSTYIFKHALTQEVAYNSLLLKRRKEIHEKIGRAIEELYPERLDEFYEMLAYHYSRSDNSEKAYQYLKSSGKKATRSYSHWEAFHFYREAINVLNQLPETEDKRREQINVRLLMSIPMYPLGYPEDSIRILQEGEELSKDLGDERGIANFYRNIGNYHGIKGKSLLAIKYQENCLQEAKKIQDFELTVQVTTELCLSYGRVGQFLKVTDVAPGVLDQLERTKGGSALPGMAVVPYSRLCSIYGLSLGMLGNFEEGSMYCEKSLLAAVEIGDSVNSAACEWHCGYLYVSKGDGKLAIEHFQKGIKYGEEAKWILLLRLVWSLSGYAYYMLGDLETARKHGEKGLRIQSDAGIELFLSSIPYWVLSLIYLDLGKLRNAQICIEEALELSQKNNERFCEGSSWISLGRILGKTDPSQSDKAEDCILHGIKILDELKIKPYCSQGYLFLGEIYAATGQREKALENLKKAEGMFQEMGMDYWLAKTQEALRRL